MSVACQKNLSIKIDPSGTWSVVGASGYDQGASTASCTASKIINSSTFASLDMEQDTNGNDTYDVFFSDPTACYACDFPGANDELRSSTFGPFDVNTDVTVAGSLTLQCAATNDFSDLGLGCALHPHTDDSFFLLQISDGIGFATLQSETCTVVEGSKIVPILGTYTVPAFAGAGWFLQIDLQTRGAGLISLLTCSVSFAPA